MLLSSAGRRVALLHAFRQSLRNLGLTGQVMAADMSPLSSAFHAADRRFLVPPCSSDEFVPAMLDVCARANVGLVVPTIDPELPVYASNSRRFADVGTTVAVSSPDVVAIGADKRATYAWLQENALPTVRQGTVEEAQRHPERWPFPLIVKPLGGSAAVGVAQVRTWTELEVAAAGGGVVVQTVATGAEHTIDILVDRPGRCVCAVPRRRLEVRAGEVSKGMTVRSAALQALARRVCELLPGAFGALNLQVFSDDAGRLSIVELNPRFGGGFPLAWQAGALLPQWLIEDVLGLASTARPDSWRDGLVMLRYDEAVFLTAREAGL